MQKIQISKQNLAIFACFFFGVLLAFLVGFFGRDVYELQKPDINLVLEAYQLVKANAYTDLPANTHIQYGMIKGLLQSLEDPYTVFLEPPQHALQSNQLQGKFGGIGVRLEVDSQGYYRLLPLPDSPASKAGVLEGDRLLRVDSLEITQGLDVHVIEAAIRGPVGQTVQLEVGSAPDFTRHVIAIVRAEYSLPSVTWNLIPETPQVGIIHASIVSANTAEEISKAYADLKGRGGRYFILDLRDNGGGLLDAGITVARLFLRDGVVEEQQFRGEKVTTARVEKPGDLADIPLVVLVNHSTASAAEIIAGALQANHRAKIIGAATFGKDSVQLVFELKDKSSIHVTAAKWWVPGTKVPIQPDIVVEGDAQARAVEELTK
jgi:carboxyl-terminal processing protease